jgi:hypothetical protein
MRGLYLDIVIVHAKQLASSQAPFPVLFIERRHQELQTSTYGTKTYLGRAEMSVSHMTIRTRLPGLDINKHINIFSALRQVELIILYTANLNVENNSSRYKHTVFREHALTAWHR